MSFPLRPKPVVTRTAPVAVGLLLLLAAAGAFAQPRPSSDLLLPYFEVDLTGYKRTTLFTVTNSGAEPVEVRMVVHSNWGIPMEEARVALDAHETRRFNLRDWLLLGELPQADGLLALLSPRRLPHLHAALSGQRSPADGHFYGTEVRPEVAVGYVTLSAHTQSAQGEGREDFLWGNYFQVDPEGDNARGDLLVDLDPEHGSPGLCSYHSLFVLGGGRVNGTAGATEVIVWTPGQGAPSRTETPDTPNARVETLARELHGEAGEATSSNLIATQILTLDQLAALTAGTGSLELRTVAGPDSRPVGSFIAVRYRAGHRLDATLQTWCLDPADATSAGPDPTPHR